MSETDDALEVLLELVRADYGGGGGLVDEWWAEEDDKFRVELERIAAEHTDKHIVSLAREWFAPAAKYKFGCWVRERDFLSRCVPWSGDAGPCPKCLFDHIATGYRDAPAEHLARTCLRCGYVWAEKLAEKPARATGLGHDPQNSRACPVRWVGPDEIDEHRCRFPSRHQGAHHECVCLAYVTARVTVS